MCRCRGSAVASIILGIGAWLAPHITLAATANGEVFTLPVMQIAGAPAPVTNGLTVKIDATGYMGIGYCPVKVTVKAAAASPSDRSLSVKITVPDSSRSQVDVKANLNLPAGATSASTVLYVPHFVNVDALNFQFFEDGERLIDLSDHLILNYSRLRLPILCPNSTDLIASGVQPLFWQLEPINRGQNSKSYSPYDLPESVLDYSSLSAVLISSDELAFVIAQRPKAWQALRLWVVSGGNLWVYGMTDKFARLADLEKLLELPERPLLSSTELNGDAQGWRLPPGDFTDQYIDSQVPVYSNNVDLTYISDPVEKARLQKEEQDRIDQQEQQRSTLRTRLKSPLFAVRRMGLGYVAALHTNNPLQEQNTFWHLLSTAIGDHDNWFTRHQVSFDGDNFGFWNFLIPGVGLPPIVAFEVLITIFVIGIGPVNYYLLRRRHKQSWLIFTVPASAALVTGCLLLYALLADGIGIRARARSFTEIDQSRGESVCWSRIAYHAGLQPSHGFEFSPETQVYPIELFDEDRKQAAPISRIIEEGTTRQFTKGWFPARTVTQFLTVRARQTAARLDVQPSTDGSPPQVVNRLGTRIEKLLIIDDHNKCSWAEDVAVGAKAQTKTIALVEGTDKLSMVFAANALEFPAAWRNQRGNRGLFNLTRRGRNAYRRSYNYSSSSLGQPPGALLEEGLARTVNADQFTPRTYIAVVERSPEFELGLGQVTSETGYHVILGHW